MRNMPKLRVQGTIMFVMQYLRREIEDALMDETMEGETVRRIVNLARF